MSRFGLGKNLLGLLLECAHRLDVRDRTVADARNTELRKPIIGWQGVHDHDVDGQRDALTDSSDQRIVRQARNEKAGRARGRVSLGPAQSFADRLCRVSALPKEQIRPRVDEEADALLPRRLANGYEPARLPVDVVEPGTLDHPVLEVDADYTQFEKTRDVSGQLSVIFARPAFEVPTDRRIDGRRDPRDDLLSELNRNGLAISVTLRLRDGPAACRDRLRARSDNGFRATRIPCVEQQQRHAFDV